MVVCIGAIDAAASWTGADELLLLNFLVQHASAAGDGGNFKMVTFTAAAAIVESERERGGVKTAKVCQNKWNQLCRIFCAIQAIKAKSGWTWSDKTGASITPNMEGAWADFLKVYKDAKPFKNKGWVYLEKVAKIMPATGVSGIDSFDDANDGVPPFPISSQVEDEEALDADDDGAVTLPAPIAAATPVIPPTPPRASRKHERADSETPVAAKRVRAGDSNKRTPHHRTQAVKLAQKEDWLVIHDCLVLCNIFKKDIKAADAYLALDPEDTKFREMWMSTLFIICIELLL
ncbi:hypothetical protein B0H34DRAFT_806797 [Crassisporium funariophilum]|nr:hypothetical protein B0H34DRAFT_806797 [Crassisporium funariophilum]